MAGQIGDKASEPGRDESLRDEKEVFFSPRASVEQDDDASRRSVRRQAHATIYKLLSESGTSLARRGIDCRLDEKTGSFALDARETGNPETILARFLESIRVVGL
jgi:hypothetical protein